MTTAQVTLASVGLILLFTLLELRVPQFRTDAFKDPQRVRRNWAFFLASLTPSPIIHAVAPWMDRTLAPSFQLAAIHPVVDIAVAVLVAELLSWCSHFAKHHVSYLWRFHFQHHREERFSVWMVTHTHALEVVFTSVVVAAVLTAMGVSPLARQLYLLLYTASVLYHHSAQGYSLGWLDRIFISPAYHRLHHEVDARCNFGAALTLYDVLFRTVEWPSAHRAHKPYGLLPGSPEPFGFWRELTWFLMPDVRRREQAIAAAQVRRAP